MIPESDYYVISVMGPHAGESEQEIFNRKIEDTYKIGKTFWLMRSWQAKPLMVQSICREAETKNNSVFSIFVAPSSVGGATPTKTSEAAQHYSKDGNKWKELPAGLTPVTGKIGSNAYALIFNELKLAQGNINLWQYADFFKQDKPIKIAQGASTLCAVKKDMSRHKDKIKSNYRKIVAIGKLCEPYCAWLR